MKHNYFTLFILVLTWMSATRTSAAEPYAIYNSGNQILEFRYDNDRYIYEASSYICFDVPQTYVPETGLGWYPYREEIKTVVFNSLFKNFEDLYSAANWFYGFKNLTSVSGLKNLNTSKMEYMRLMFFGCSSLTSLDLSSFDTSKVTEMGYMFYGCSSLTSLDLSSFNTSNVTNMEYMFYCCISLTSLDLSSFNTSNVRGMKNMFNGCFSLKTIYCRDKWTCGDSDAMFYYCYSLKGAIAYDENKTSGEYANPDTGYFTYGVPVAMFDTDNGILTFAVLPPHEAEVRSGSYPHWIGSEFTDYDYAPAWLEYADKIKSVQFSDDFKRFKPTSLTNWFLNCEKLEGIYNISNLITDDVTEMDHMLYGCSSLTSLDLSGFNTSQVTNMNSMFSGCGSLTSLDLSSFDTSKVTDMTSMFYNCTSLTTIWCDDTWKCDNSELMFSNCTSLQGAVWYKPNFTDASMANPETGYFTYSAPDGYDLWLCGTQVTRANCGDLTQIEGVTVSDGGYVRYLPKDKVLSLHNATISCGDATPLKCGIDGLEIQCGAPDLDPSPSFIQSTTATPEQAMEVAANTTILGSDALFVLGGTLLDPVTAGIYLNGGDLTIRNTTLAAVGTSGLIGKTGPRWTHAYSLIVKGKLSYVMAMGAGGASLGGLYSLELSDGLAITSPEGAEFVDGYVSLRSDVSIDPVTYEGVIIQYVEPDHIPGDVNEDGEVDINDVVAVINQMAGTASWRYANVNGDTDGNVDINDVVAIINIMAGK